MPSAFHHDHVIIGALTRRIPAVIERAVARVREEHVGDDRNITDHLA